MALKTLVKVGNISNLSDARYCAGMGVDLLGFAAVEGQPNYIPPKLYQDIRGWVAGTSFVLELYGLKESNALQKMVEDYRPDYLEVSLAELELLPASVEQSLIVLIASSSDLRKIGTWKNKIQYLLVNEDQNEIIQQANNIAPVILSLRSASGLSLLNTHIVKGVALSGSAEVRPGYKDYDDLAEVLERLEVD